MSGTPLQRVLDRLEDVRGTGGGKFKALCPAHPDKNPSLSVKLGDEGQVLLHCFGGCDRRDVLKALGLTDRDLFSANGADHRNGAGRNGKRKPMGKIIREYNYTDADGVLLYQAVRKEPKGFFQRRPGGPGEPEWVNSLDDVKERVLYRLPALASLAAGTRVYVPEGEKDVENLVVRGLEATTPAGGADSPWLPEFTDALQGMEVVIIPDYDPAGYECALERMTALHEAGVKVAVLELPDLALKGDVSDWLGASGTREQLEEMATAALATPGVFEGFEEKLARLEALAAEAKGQVTEREPPWEEPVPITAAAPDEFPVDVFPGWLQDKVEAVAEATQTPLALAGNLALSVLGAILQKRVEFLVREGWRETLSIYTATALPPGNRKSRVFEEMAAPLIDGEFNLMREHAPLIAAANAERGVLEASLKRAKEDAAKGKQTLDEVRGLAQALEKFIVPTAPRLLADDITTEALGILMSENGGRIAIFSDEGGIFALMAGRYSSGIPNLDLFLKGHCGGLGRVDRVGRAPIYIPRAALTFGLAVQPEVLRGLLDVREFEGRGLLARFAYGVPTSTVGKREIRPKPCPQQFTDAYLKCANALLDIVPQKDEQGELTPYILTAEPGADDCLADFEREIEPMMAPGRDSSMMIEWRSKQAGLAAKIAALTHQACLVGSDDPWSIPVSEATMVLAVKLARCHASHARAAFGLMSADPATAHARRVLAWLQGKKVKTFTLREAYHAVDHVIPRTQDVAAGVAVLLERGYLREEMQTRQGPGRLPSPKYQVHPSVWGQN